MKNNDLIKRLVDKSIEAFLMGLEVYNKPTIKYRIEGFSFFICNAWELMLKAELLQRNKSIYYPDSDRTFDLSKTIKCIYTDKNQPLRINLEYIIQLRNLSTHFITEDYETIYAPLFQACVFNFSEQIKRFHNIDLTNYVAQNFLTLTANLNMLTNEEIKAKYSSEMANQILKTRDKIHELTEDIHSNDLFIPLNINFYQTKNIKNADVVFSIDNTSNNKIQKIKELIDPAAKFTLSAKQLNKAINKQIQAKNITLNYKAGNGSNEFNMYTLNLFNSFYSLKENNNYCYSFAGFHRYSQQAVDFIVEEIKKDPNIIIKIKRALKKTTSGS